MMTLAVSHHPSSFLTGVAPASAGFRLGSIIRVKTPFLVISTDLSIDLSMDLPASSGGASYTGAARPRQAARLLAREVGASQAAPASGQQDGRAKPEMSPCRRRRRPHGTSRPW